jgi:RimJ/RimL family protein N-acetyltransferase
MRFYPHPYSLEEPRAWIERWDAHQADPGFSLWAIEDVETGEFLGDCGPVMQLIDDEQHVKLVA